MAAIIGVEEVMQAAQSSFISSTYWTERIGPTAALATIRKIQRCEVPKHLVQAGERVQVGWNAAADRAGLLIRVSGIAPISHFTFSYPNGQAIRTLFTQIMLEIGYLASDSFYATYAHQSSHIEGYLTAVDKAFGVIARALDRGEVEKLLRGSVAHSGFQRLT